MKISDKTLNGYRVISSDKECSIMSYESKINEKNSLPISSYFSKLVKDTSAFMLYHPTDRKRRILKLLNQPPTY